MKASNGGREKSGADGKTLEVLVVDDHRILREGLKRIMEDEPDMEVAGEAWSVADLKEKLGDRDWDVLVLDISLPDRSGLDALEEIREMRPEMPVLILSMHSDNRYARQALAKGASGYVTKASAAEEIVEAVRRVAGGGIFLGEPMARELSGRGE